jgi:hypothetical protein
VLDPDTRGTHKWVFKSHDWKALSTTSEFPMSFGDHAGLASPAGEIDLTALRWLKYGAIALGMILIMFFLVARFFSEGPIGAFPGGAFQTGSEVIEEFDWDVLSDRQTVELQLVTPPRSRKTWILVLDGSAYIPCGFPNFTLWKQWPHQALDDPRALVRVRRDIIPVNLRKVDDPSTFESLRFELGQKYDEGSDLTPDRLWFFRLDQRLE